MAQKIYLMLKDLSDLIAIRSEFFKLKDNSMNTRQQITKIVDMYRAETRQKNINVVLMLNKVDTTICLDQERFTQVFHACFINTLKHASNSTITVEAKIKDGEQTLSNNTVQAWVLSTGKNGDHTLQLQVADSGWNVSNDQRANLFKPVALKEISEAESKPPTEFGLYIARLITKKYGGDIIIESDPIKGSLITFEFKLDLSLIHI